MSRQCSNLPFSTLQRKYVNIVEFYQPLDPTNQYIQHIDQVDMLIHSFGFTCPVPYKTYKTLCLTYEPAWHLDLCQNCPCLPVQQNNTLNTWQKNILSHFWNLQPLDPTKAIRSKKRRKLTCSHVESFLKLCPPRPYKANGWTSAENWHVGLFLKIITSRYPASTPPCSTGSIWTKLTCWVVVVNVLPPSLLKRNAQHINQFGILSHCYVFSPLSPTKTLLPTYKTTWHHEPCLRCFFIPLKIITLKLNIWTKWNVINCNHSYIR